MSESTTTHIPGCSVCGCPYLGMHYLNCPRMIPAPCPGCAEKDAQLAAARTEIEKLDGMLRGSEAENVRIREEWVPATAYEEECIAREKAERELAEHRAGGWMCRHGHWHAREGLSCCNDLPDDQDAAKEQK